MNRKSKARVTVPQISEPAKAADVRLNKRHSLFILVFCGLLIVAYLPAVKGGFIWDDDGYVTQNATLHNLHGLGDIWFNPGATQQYYPLVHTSFWLEYHLWRLNPLGFHLVNVGLHGLAAFLLFRVLTKLRVPGAWLAATIFALHPVEVESVAWVTERKNLLSAVFYLAAVLAWLQFAPPEDENGAPVQKRWKLYALALLWFTCAMLSKTVACSFPAAMLIVRWWKTGRLRFGDFLPLVPFFLLGAAGGWWTSSLEKHHVGAEGVDWSLNFAQRVLIAGRALWFYIMKLVWPVQLTFSYPRWHVDPNQLWQWLFPVVACGGIVSLFLYRKRIGRGPLAATLFFAGTLLPALGFINIFPMRFTFVADHYQYFASIGMIVLFSTGLVRLPRWAVMAMLLLLAGLTWRQGHIYKDVKTLWTDTLAKNPESWLAHENLGTALFEEGNWDAAMNHFETASQLNPQDPVAISNVGSVLSAEGKLDEAMICYEKAISLRPQYGRAQYGMATALMKKGQKDQAMRYFRKAAGIYPEDADVQNTLGSVLLENGEYQEAASSFTRALRVQPNRSDIQNNLGLALSHENNVDEAISEYEQSLRLKPDSSITHGYLGSLLLRKGRLDEAINHLQQSVKLDPSNAYMRTQLGLAFGKKGSLDEAIPQFEAAVRLNPNDAMARNFFGVTLARKGNLDEAMQQFEEAIRLKPDFAEAHVQYGTALAAKGKIDDAAAEYRTALKIHPDYPDAQQRLQALSATPVH